jgi:hypothetical protein
MLRQVVSLRAKADAVVGIQSTCTRQQLPTAMGILSIGGVVFTPLELETV